MITHNFENSKDVGEWGEKIIAAWVKQQVLVTDIQDLTKDTEYQKKDIDFLVSCKRFPGVPPQFTLEVKTDSYNSGNIFYETVSNTETGTPGCMVMTEANYVAYYLTAYKKVYFLNINLFRNWVEQIQKDSRLMGGIHDVQVRNVKRSAAHKPKEELTEEDYFYSQGLTIPIFYIDSFFNAFRVFSIDAEEIIAEINSDSEEFAPEL